MRRAVLSLIACLAAPVAPAMAQTWLADAARTLPSTDTGWHGLAFDPAAARLFVARRADGLLAFDVATGFAATLQDSAGANAIILLPTPGRAYAGTTAGDLIAFDPATLAPIARSNLGVGDIQGGLYEPTENRVHLQAAANGDKTLWITIDAATGEKLGRTEFNSRQMGTPTTDDAGVIFAPLRDRGLIQQLAAKDLAVEKTFKLPECTDPVATKWDGASRRILLLCGGDKPAFVALDPKAGVVANMQVGRGADSIAVDPSRHLLVVANGTDGTLTIIRDGSTAAAPGYSIVETIGTRPGARQVAFDPSTGYLYTAAATTTTLAPTPDNKQPIPIHHPNSFTILAYRPAASSPVP